MANNQNLRPFNTMTPEQRRAISQKGGKASGAARRERRKLIEEDKAAIRAQREIDADDLTMLCRMVKGLYRDRYALGISRK